MFPQVTSSHILLEILMQPTFLFLCFIVNKKIDILSYMLNLLHNNIPYFNQGVLTCSGVRSEVQREHLIF